MPTYAPPGEAGQGKNNLYARLYRFEAFSDG